MSIKIDTGKVKSSSNKITSYNSEIFNDFFAMETAINNLNSNWDSDSSNLALQEFFNIKNAYHSSRYNVVDGMVKFINTYGGDQYEYTENKIVSAATYFR